MHLDEKEGVLSPDHPSCQSIKYICPTHGKKGKKGGNKHSHGKKSKDSSSTMQNHHPVVSVVLPEYHFLCRIQCPAGTVPFHLNLMVDEYPEETSWHLEDSEGNIVQDADFGEVTASDVYQRCVPVDACFTFRIFDSAGDGVGNGGYFLFLDGMRIHEGREFEYEETVQIGDCDGTMSMTPPPTPLNCNNGEVSVRVELTTDLFPNEISWSFQDFQGSTILSGGPYESQVDRIRTFVEETCVVDHDCNSFSIMDSFGDGIIAPGSYAVYLDGNLQGNVAGCFANSIEEIVCNDVESECYEERECDPRTAPQMRDFCDPTKTVDGESCQPYCLKLSWIPRAPRQPKCVNGDISPINCS